MEIISSSWKIVRLSVLLFGLLNAAQAQKKQAQASPADASIEPRIQLSFVHSCRPSQAEAEQMQRVLQKVNSRPSFSPDFEISRGVVTLTPKEAAAAGVAGKGAPVRSPWVRIRREFPAKALLSQAQYSVSVEGRAATEVLALHLRETDEALQILISTSAVGSATDMVQTDTPPGRIQVERFGKGALVLARCAKYDQSSYEPVFRTAGEIMRTFRAAMAVKAVVPGEMARLPHARRAAGKKAGGR